MLAVSRTVRNRPYLQYSAPDWNDLCELLDYLPGAYGQRVAFAYRRGRDEVVEVTHAGFHEDVRALGEGLRRRCAGGERIALVGPNSYEWVVAYLAIVTTGNVVVPLDKELGAGELIELLDAGGCARVLAASAQRRTLEAAATGGNLDIWSLDGTTSDFVAIADEGRSALARGQSRGEPCRIAPDTVAAVIFTSGTTGKPKGVMLSHRNIASNVSSMARWFRAAESSLLVLPLHHAFGMTAGTLANLAEGTTVVISRGLKEIKRDLVEFRPTDTILVPLFLETMHKNIWVSARAAGKEGLLRVLVRLSDALLGVGIDLRPTLFRSVREAFGGRLARIISGAAPLDPALIRGFRSFGIDVRQGYGITECAPVVSVCRNHHYRDESVGVPLPGVEVRIADPDVDGNGEIWVHGPNVMLGYLDDPDETDRVLRDGWFNTEDIGCVDDDGFLYINGRKKNLIILPNGKNISAEELEVKIARIDVVKECVVRGDHDGRDAEQQIVAELYLDDEILADLDVKGEADRRALVQSRIDELNRGLPLYKNITRFELRDDEFPKTTTKKIKR